VVGGSQASTGINSVNVDKAQNTAVPGGNIAPAPAAKSTTPAATPATTPADTSK
jgi:preprotein translocase subunit SecG